MKKNFIIFCFLLITKATFAQTTWNGSISSVWTNPSNWSAGVPSATTNITIPGGVPNNPKLTSDVTVNTVNFTAGSIFDVNGFVLNIAASSDYYNFIFGATFNNSDANTDIVINFNTGTAGYYTQIRSNTFNDNITFNLTGTNSFSEGDAGTANIYSGNATFNITTSLPFFLSNSIVSDFNGNLVVNRTTTAGNSTLFGAGGDVSGNFSYINSAGGITNLGNNSNASAIAGQINIDIDNAISSSDFNMFKIANQTTGGIIDVNSPGGFNVQLNTLKVTSFSLLGIVAHYGYVYDNIITGNFSLADGPTNSGGYATYIRGNTLTGTINFTINGTNSFNEADIANKANHFIGNTTFTAVNSSILNISNSDDSIFDGNLTIARNTIMGITNAFGAGATINGDFSLINTIGGATNLGNLTIGTNISGKLNISINTGTSSDFKMYKLANLITGGSINVQSLGGADLRNNVLLLTNLTIGGYNASFVYILNNQFTSNVNISDNATNGGGYETLIRSNTITGHSIFTVNGTNNFKEADIAASANHFIGVTDFIATNSGTLYLSYGSKSIFDGNLNITRNTVAGATISFNEGADIAGNFSLINTIGGEVTLGNLVKATTIIGTINISINTLLSSNFKLYGFTNQTNGGAINIQSLGGFDLQNNSLKLVNININGNSNSYGYLINNQVVSNVSIADDPANAGGYATYIRSNTITGTSSFTIKGTNQYYESDIALSANHYIGNTTFTAINSSQLNISKGDKSIFDGNLSIFRNTVGAITQAFYAGATINGNLIVNNTIGGDVILGNGTVNVDISGKVDMNINHTANSTTELNKLINQTSGGIINIQSPGAYSFFNNNLKVNSITAKGVSSQYGRMHDNIIIGDVTVEDSPSNGGGYTTTIRRNTITGNTSFKNTGTNGFFDASDDAGPGNTYIGNATYIRTGTGNMSVGTQYVNSYSKNLTLNSPSGITTSKIKFNGSTNGVLEQLGSQVLNIALMTMEKTGSQTLTLNDPLNITSSLTFNGGIIISSTTNSLNILDNVTHSGASNTSYVDGPVNKTGNDIFTFPVGNGGFYAPLSITAPAGIDDQLVASYSKIAPGVAGYNPNLKDVTINRILNNEYWLLDKVAGSPSVKVTLSYSSSRSGPINALSDLVVAHFISNNWKDEGNGGNSGNLTLGYVTTLNALSTFSPFTLGSTVPFVALPVRLESFTAKKQNDNAKSGSNVLLEWKTSEEANLSHFDLEYSNNSIEFSSIAKVESKSQKGNQFYNFVDSQNIDATTKYYRLKMVDADGSFTRSKIISITNDSPQLISLYPNPAHEKITITGLSGAETVTILGINGNLLDTNKMNSTFDIGNYPPGKYVLQFESKGNIVRRSFIKQ